MKVELKRWDRWHIGAVVRMIVGIIIGVALAIYVIAFQSALDDVAIIFPLGLIAIFVWGLNTYANPNKLDCMEVVKGEMTFDELKAHVEAEEFEEPLCFWDFTKGEKRGYRLLVSGDWLLLGATMDRLVCIPKERVAKVGDACIPRSTGGGAVQEAHFIDIFLDDGKEYLPGFARQDGDSPVAEILREHFPNAKVEILGIGSDEEQGPFLPAQGMR